MAGSCKSEPKRGAWCFFGTERDPQFHAGSRVIVLSAESRPSMKAANARALALARRPVGNTAQRSIGGSVQSRSTERTLPLRSSGANIH